MLDDLYASQNETIVNDLIARPPQAKPQAAKFSAWKATTAAPRGVAAGSAESAGFAADILGAFGQVAGAYPEIMGGPVTPEQSKQADKQREKLLGDGIDYSSEGGDVFRGVAKSYMPDPATAHAAEQTVFGLTRFGTKAVGYSLMAGPAAGSALLGADEAMTTADALRLEGVDLATRTKVGAVSGVVGAAGVALPIAGKTVAQTVGLVAAGGPGAFIGQQAATRQILQDAGYDHLATQYDPFDPVGLAVSTLVPAGFGAWAMRGARSKVAAKADGAPMEKTPVQSASDDAAQPTPARPTPEQVDAARVEMLTQHLEKSGLYKPDDAKAAAMHLDAFAKSLDDLGAGRRVDVTDLVAPDRIETAKALDTFARGLEDARAELMAQAAMRAEPGAIRQMQTELADAQVQLSALDDPAAIKARATELQQADRISFKQAMTAARKEFATQSQDLQARIARIESLIEDNATATQAVDALGRLERQSQQIATQRAGIDAPPVGKTATAAAAVESADMTKGQANGGATGSTVRVAAGEGRNAGPVKSSGMGDVGPSSGASVSGSEARSGMVRQSADASPAGRAAGSDALASQVAAQRLADIQTEFPDLTVQMDGMDSPMRLADFLEQVQREAMDGNDFDLGGNDAPLMQVAATCFLLNG